jgi:hypothetical protein
MDFRVTCCEGGRWIELVQDRVQWRALILAVLRCGLCYQAFSKMDFKVTCCEGGRWMELAQDRVQWRALILAVLNLGIVIPEM